MLRPESVSVVAFMTLLHLTSHEGAPSSEAAGMTVQPTPRVTAREDRFAKMPRP